jgi:hypothetical protein
MRGDIKDIEKTTHNFSEKIRKIIENEVRRQPDTYKGKIKVFDGSQTVAGGCTIFSLKDLSLRQAIKPKTLLNYIQEATDESLNMSKAQSGKDATTIGAGTKEGLTAYEEKLAKEEAEKIENVNLTKLDAIEVPNGKKAYIVTYDASAKYLDPNGKKVTTGFTKAINDGIAFKEQKIEGHAKADNSIGLLKKQFKNQEKVLKQEESVLKQKGSAFTPFSGGRDQIGLLVVSDSPLNLSALPRQVGKNIREGFAESPFGKLPGVEFRFSAVECAAGESPQAAYTRSLDLVRSRRGTTKRYLSENSAAASAYVVWQKEVRRVEAVVTESLKNPKRMGAVEKEILETLGQEGIKKLYTNAGKDLPKLSEESLKIWNSLSSSKITTAQYNKLLSSHIYSSTMGLGYGDPVAIDKSALVTIKNIMNKANSGRATYRDQVLLKKYRQSGLEDILSEHSLKDVDNILNSGLQ